MSVKIFSHETMNIKPLTFKRESDQLIVLIFEEGADRIHSGSSARWDLCGGSQVTGCPTVTTKNQEPKTIYNER